ncbi:MAG TPA: alanine--tRNA ligase [Pyrinomonadaceae bacterium]|jgi:alanyl-tRNA synthetase
MTGNEIRESFLQYFERHGHTRVRSSPLLPANDPTLLFTNAGMNQFKDVFLGLEKREYVRACSSQKCVRAGGKHNDLDEVGKTARHQTFFEMLGNFSFGDYFKEDAIRFAWDFLVNELKLDPKRMWFSVFEGDDEVGPDVDAEKFWEQVGAPRERILRFGRKDNFWQMGETGPCGPCSEIHYYMGPEAADAENCAANVNGPGDTITEIWNLVFMQFVRSEVETGSSPTVREGSGSGSSSTVSEGSGSGSSPTVREGVVQYQLTPLPAPSVDTGMGLERLTVVLQGVKSNYETDLLSPIIEFAAALAGKVYNAETQEGFAMRVIADHARSTAFLIADGILPGNEGRNYVLRKIMRRAIYQGRHTLKFSDSFFYKVTNFVVDQMREPYPELEVQRGFIEKMVKLEEERFATTMTVGLQKLDETLHRIIKEEAEKISDSSVADQASSDEGYVLGEDDASVAERSYIISRKTGKVIHVKVTKADGTVTYESIDNLPKWEKAKIEELEMTHRLAQPAREAYEQMRPAIDAAAKARDAYNQMRPAIEAHERIRPAFEAYEKMRSAIPNYDQIRRQIDAYRVIKSLAPLYDTFGTPRDLIRVGLEERGFDLDEEQFNESFDEALQELQQTAAEERGEGKSKTNPIYTSIASRTKPSQFKGYETTRLPGAKAVILIKRGSEVQELTEGDEGEVIFDQTPFYAESGGQVGDVGRLRNPPATAGGTDLSVAGRGDLLATVLDTYSPAQGLIVHKVKIEKGSLKVGDTVTAEVDVEKRDATRRNHTATHLMHAALREVLGTHVKQAGSVVAPTYLRFDFSHYQPLTPAEIEEIENLVNYHILRNEPVETNEMAVEEAMRSGAMALFGEKYGEKVRVLSIKGADNIFSRELCGGTHVRATGDIGLFKILSDESIASGVRRIRAVTGVDAFQRFRESESMVDKMASDLRTSRSELPAVIGKLQEDLKKTRREADELRMKIATGAVGSASANGDEARDVAGVKVLAREASGLDSAGMRQLSDTLLARIKSGVVVLGRSSDGKVSLIVRTSDDLTGRVPAGKVIKELAPIVGGKGGGKPDMAEGGGALPEKLPDALEASYSVIEKLLS